MTKPNPLSVRSSAGWLGGEVAQQEIGELNALTGFGKRAAMRADADHAA
ncbi:MAG: hypothetical protein ABL964_13350 [Steroidobacteraceae bacterium]